MSFEAEGLNALLNYGVLGIWTVFNLTTITYYRKKQEYREEQLTQVIRENTKAMVTMTESVRLCHARSLR